MKKPQNEKFISDKSSALVPKSYIDFKNKWAASQKREPQVKGWVKEKNQERTELRKLKKEKHKHKKIFGNKFNSRMKFLKSSIRKIHRKTHKKQLNKSNS